MPTTFTDNYSEYAELAVRNYHAAPAEQRYALIGELGNLKPETILDLGCGAGQQLLPFLEKTEAVCVGVDAAAQLSKESGKVRDLADDDQKRLHFVRSRGECLPFADASFDVVLCLVALPYMNNRQALKEIGRVLKTDGKLFLKIHAALFYFGMLPSRLKTLNPKAIAYPLICLAGSLWHQLTGRQLENGFWRGKEIYQTAGFLHRELAANKLEIEGFLPDDNRQTPSFVIVKR